MKLSSFSISVLWDAFRISIQRFPLALSSAFGFAFISLYLIEVGNNHTNPDLHRLMFTLAIGLPLFVGLQLLAEHYLKNPVHKYFLFTSGVLFLVLIFIFIAPDFEAEHLQRPVRFLSFFLIAHLLISLSPYFKSGSIHEFWEFNKDLFISWFIGAFYSMVIYTGLTLALLAIDNLFDVHIKWERNAQIFVVIFTMFHPMYILSNFPKTIYPNLSTSTYTRAIRNLVIYILIPLTILYFFILYAYGLKIVVSWELPKGWVSSLVLGFSGIGVITYLLNFELPKRESNKISVLFKKYFFYVLTPLIILLFTAIFRRLSDYGFTPPRYFVLITGCWLFLTCLYFLISKTDNIKWIPGSLIIFLLLGTMSPFDAFHISSSSQYNRLISLFEKNQLLEQGKIKAIPDSMSTEDKESAEGMIYALYHLGDLQKVSDLLVEPIQVDTIGHYDPSSFIVSKIGLNLSAPSRIGSDNIYLTSTEQSDYVVSDYDWIFLIREPTRSDDYVELLDDRQKNLVISGIITDTIPLGELFYSLDKKYRDTHSNSIQDEPFDVSTNSYRHSLFIKRLGYSKTGSGLRIDNFNAVLLSAKK